MFKHKLGLSAETRTTGLKGILMSRAQWLFGCNRYHIQPKVDKDNKVPNGWWVDEDDIKILGDGIILEKKEGSKLGGPMSKLI